MLMAFPKSVAFTLVTSVVVKTLEKQLFTLYITTSGLPLWCNSSVSFFMEVARMTDFLVFTLNERSEVNPISGYEMIVEELRYHFEPLLLTPLEF